MVDRALMLLTQQRLIEWGKWCHRILTGRLKISSHSLIDRLNREGGIIIPATDQTGVPNNPMAEEVNDAIERLTMPKPTGEDHADWAAVLRIHCTLHEHDEEFRLVAAKQSRDTYYRHLRQGKTWLAHTLYLSSKE
ncbi:MAG: hypothetical protein GY821_13285 [Gammaproteobacteria bacterium]|nr:hypothetical protein [Gammaproteobacteria bacterium]